jgi:hypothetical protein
MALFGGLILYGGLAYCLHRALHAESRRRKNR